MSDPVARLNAALEGRYAIERELGEGGMATVYLADDKRVAFRPTGGHAMTFHRLPARPLEAFTVTTPTLDENQANERPEIVVPEASFATALNCRVSPIEVSICSGGDTSIVAYWLRRWST